jgi:uncharacterized repeat protein (TIGR04138 family)
MSDSPAKRLEQVVEDTRRYPRDAFQFVREGLNFAVDRVHGEETSAHRALAEHLAEQEMDWGDLIAAYHSGMLDDTIVQVIDDAGGIDNLNRHVSGRQLCWGLRDFALERWGLMARTVLNRWRIDSTSDFGRIVFAFIEHNLMQKQPEDTLEDFEDVYDFQEAFDGAFRTALNGKWPRPGEDGDASEDADDADPSEDPDDWDEPEDA